MVSIGYSFEDPAFTELPEWQKPIIGAYIYAHNFPLALEWWAFSTVIPTYVHGN